jgi:hypothetical protein
MYSTWHVRIGRKIRQGYAYIRVASQLLDDGIIKVARVAQESAGNVKGVLKTSKSIVDEGDLGSLPQLQPPGLVLLVKGVDEDMVGGDAGRVNVGLELDDVRVGDGFGVGGRQERGGIVVDGSGAEHRVGVGNHAQQLEG